MRAGLLALATAALFAGAGAAGAGNGTLPEYRLLLLDGQRVKWGEPVLGTAAVVTYAIVDRELHFPKARNCAGIGPVGEILSANRISRKVFESELDAAFAAWQAIAGVTFQRADADRAHILIGAQTEPRGRAFTNVAYDTIIAGREIGTIRQALICLNPDESWKVGFDGNLNSFDLRYTLTHEIGRARQRRCT